MHREITGIFGNWQILEFEKRTVIGYCARYFDAHNIDTWSRGGPRSPAIRKLFSTIEEDRFVSDENRFTRTIRWSRRASSSSRRLRRVRSDDGILLTTSSVFPY